MTWGRRLGANDKGGKWSRNDPEPSSVRSYTNIYFHFRFEWKIPRPDFILPSENFISLFRENQTNNNVNSLRMDTPLDYRHVTAIVRELSVELREGLNTEGLYNFNPSLL